MPKKTLILVIALVFITIVLFVIALQSSNNPQMVQAPSPTQSAEMQAVNVPTEVPKNTVLTLNPSNIQVVSGTRGSADVNIDTGGDEVTAVQLEIAYDPNFIGNIQIKPGNLFTNSVELINKNDVENGRYTFAFGITPNSTPIQGTGSAAVITFTAKNQPGQTTQLGLLPSSLITARGISNSVLKSAEGALVVISPK